MLHASVRLGAANTLERKEYERKSLYKAPPERQQPSRAVYAWVASLGGITPVQSPRRDLANGFVVAQILAHYYPVRRCALLSVAHAALDG